MSSRIKDSILFKKQEESDAEKTELIKNSKII